MPGVPEFKFFTDHGNALLLIADLLDITECVAQRVVADLSEAGYVDLVTEGHRNIYSIKTDLRPHLPFQRDVDIRALLGLLREHNS
jgi:hypothetical protein